MPQFVGRRRRPDGEFAVVSYMIDDALDPDQPTSVEVVIDLGGGRRRWCFFVTPAVLATVGDWVEGSQVRVHLGVSHMIVVGELNADVIDRVLRALEAQGLIEEHTSPFEEAEGESGGV